MNHHTTEKQAGTLAAKRTRTLLMAGLFSLLQETNFEKITLTELCSRSLVPRSTFYRYFDDKYDLLYFGIRTFLDRAGLDEDVLYLKNEESMRRFTRGIIEIMDSQKDAFLKIWHKNRDSIFMEVLRNCLIRILNDRLKEADGRGLKPKIPLPILTCLLVDFYISAVKCYLELSDQYDPEQFTNHVLLFTAKDFFRSDDPPGP